MTGRPVATGLGNASMVLGIATTVGAAFVWLLAEGMSREALGRGIESDGQAGPSVFGAVGCVSALFVAIGLAGLGLGALGLSRSGRGNVPAVVGCGLCGVWLLVGAIVLLLRA